jgi:spermidine synthase
VGAVAVAVRPAPWTLPVSTEGGRGQWDAVGIAGGIGCVSFALQVAWNRVFALLLGSSAYTFALVVAAILAGLGFGGTAEGAREAEDDAEAWGTAARRCLALAIAVYVGMLVVHVAPFHLVTTAARGGSTALLRLALVALVVVWPSYQIGALFPLLAARFPSAHVGRATGRAALVATAGNVVGALGGAFVTVPRFGTQWTLAASAAVSLVLAVVAARRASGARLRGTLMAVVLACALGALLYPRWDPVGLSAGAYRAGLYRAGHGDPRAPCGPGRRLARSRVLFHRDGALGTVVVLGHPGGSDCSLYSLRVNGKAEGSVFVAAPLGSAVGIGSPVLPVGDLPVEVLAGWLPGRAGPPARDAFVVGWGTGFTARALVEAGAKHVTAVEIEPAVLDAARVFDAALLRDPRVTVQVDDARMALRRAPSRAFDVVVSHPSNPWVVGAASLFSREYWSLVRDRLRPGGRALAWVQLYEIDREAARTLVATFVSVFPDAHAFRVGPQSRDLLLLGFASDAPTSREALRAALAAPMEAPARAQLARAGFADGDAVMATHLADGAALVRYARGAVVNTDDSGRIEFRVADHVLAGTGEPVEAILRGL